MEQYSLCLAPGCESVVRGRLQEYRVQRNLVATAVSHTAAVILLRFLGSIQLDTIESPIFRMGLIRIGTAGSISYRRSVKRP